MKALPSITLEQYAGIRAALAEEHALEAVLAQEGVPSWRWPAIDGEMSDAITAEKALFGRYCEKLQEAEELLARDVAPLFDDLAAWTGFVAAFGSDGGVLDKHGLRATDLGRLQRHWQRRFEQEVKLAKQARSFALEPPTPPEKIRVGESMLTPFPWSPPPDEAKAGCALRPVDCLTTTAPMMAGSDERALPFEGSRSAPPATLAIMLTPDLGKTAQADHASPRASTPFEPWPVAPLLEVAMVAGEVAASELPASMPLSPEPPAMASLPSRSSASRPVAPAPARKTELSLESTQDEALPFRGGDALEAWPFGGSANAPPPVVAALEAHPDVGMTTPMEAPVGMTTPMDDEPGALAFGGRPAPNSWRREDYESFEAELASSEDRQLTLVRWRVSDDSMLGMIRARFAKNDSGT